MRTATWAERREYRSPLSWRQKMHRGMRRYGRASWVFVAGAAITTVALVLFSALAASICGSALFLGFLYLTFNGFELWNEDLMALGDSPPLKDSFLVDLVVRREGQSIGKDSGQVCFVDGWLVYTGLRTTFSVGAVRCRKQAIPTGLGLLSANAGYSIRTDECEVEFFLGPKERDRAIEFDRAQARFVNGPEPFGVDRLPPRSLAPGVLRRSRIEYMANLSWVAIVALLLAVTVAQTRGAGEYLPALGPAIWLCSCVCALRSAHTRLRTLRRLTRESERNSETLWEPAIEGSDRSPRPQVR